MCVCCIALHPHSNGVSGTGVLCALRKRKWKIKRKCVGGMGAGSYYPGAGAIKSIIINNV